MRGSQPFTLASLSRKTTSSCNDKEEFGMRAVVDSVMFIFYLLHYSKSLLNYNAMVQQAEWISLQETLC